MGACIWTQKYQLKHKSIFLVDCEKPEFHRLKNKSPYNLQIYNFSEIPKCLKICFFIPVNATFLKTIKNILILEIIKTIDMAKVNDLLIVEMSSNQLSVASNEGKEYVLEGIFGELTLKIKITEFTLKMSIYLKFNSYKIKLNLLNC